MKRPLFILLLTMCVTACTQEAPELPSVQVTPDAIRPAPPLAPPPSPVEAPAAPARHVLQVSQPEHLLALHHQRSLALALEASPATALSIVHLPSGIVRARVPLGREQLHTAAPTPDGWVLLTAQKKLLKLTFEGVLLPLPPSPCEPEKLVSDSAGNLLLMGSACALIRRGETWSILTLQEGERPRSGALADKHVALFVESPSGACQLIRQGSSVVSPEGSPSAPASINPPGGSAEKPSAAPVQGSGTEQPPEDSTSSPRVSWSGPCPELVALDRDGTLYGGTAAQGILKLEKSLDAKPQPLTGIPTLLAASIQPQKKRVLGLSPDKRLVEYQLTDGTVMETSALPERIGALTQGIVMWAPEDSGILAIGSSRGPLEPNVLKPALLLDEEHWLELPAWQAQTTLQICASAWISEQDSLLAVALEPAGELIKTHMLMVPREGGELKPFAVGSDPKKGSGEGCQLQLSPEGKVAAVYSGTSVKLMDLETRQRIGKSTVPGVTGLAFSADSGSLYVATREGVVRRGEVPGLDDPTPITRYDQGLQAFSTLTEGDLLLFATPSGTGARVELMTGERQQVLSSLSVAAPVKSLSVAQKGARMALGLGAQGVQLWTLPANRAITLSQSVANVVALTSDGMAAAWGEATLHMHQAGKQSMSWEQALYAPVTGLSWASRRRCLAVVDASGALSLWNSSGVRTLALYALSAEHWILQGRNNAWNGRLDRPDRLWRIFPNLKESIVSLPSPASQAQTSAQSECR
ncbi:MAG: WD40 repeat domain-containing protein [Myxococcota bacterium]